MRSQSFLRKSHLLFKPSQTYVTQPLILLQSSPRSLRYKRVQPPSNVLLTSRCISSSAVESEENTISNPTPESLSGRANDDVPEQSVNIEEKASTKPRRSRIASSSSKDDLEFPPGLEEGILYLPTESLLGSQPNRGLPPPEIFQEALDNLLITLHPQNQHRAMHASGDSGRLVEPTLGLYCPIEGGDYVIDLTVRELAYQTGAEVLVLDAVHLAAGEWGPFGKAADSLNLPNNPLHFSSPAPSSSRQSGRHNSAEEEEEEEEGSPSMFVGPSRLSFTINKPFSALQNRGLVGASSRKAAPPSKLDNFFDTLVNLSLPPDEKQGETPSMAIKTRPRLIYIRDFPTLASSSSSWYPQLLGAVKQRRRRLLFRSPNTTSSPVTIIFGMTPPVTPHWNEGSAGPSNSNLMNILMNRNSPSSNIDFGTKAEHIHDWSESEPAEAAREKRLRNRLKKWERSSTALHEEFPVLPDPQDGDSSRANVILIGGGSDSQMSIPPLLGMPLGLDQSTSSGDDKSQFFRSSILVPRSRSIPDERETRIARRRETNELTMRMGVGAVGGIIEPKALSSVFSLSESPPDQTADALAATPSDSLWKEWGNKTEVWSSVRKIADRAMGSMLVLQQALNCQEKVTLAPTIVPWSAVQSAWTSYNSISNNRMSWLKETLGSSSLTDGPEGKEKLLNAGSETDKVVESVKNDPDLDQHEARLLPCIVDSLAIKTTFNQVHLPSHTIDSIRTIVSLPLLHPHAFQQGILKEHSMTGCLLFGPPGTGKTLAVRALAKEAGCRMLAVSPSDVMDMYVGEGEKLVKAVFSLARRLSPCVVFLDEIDALFGARMSARESGSAFAHRGVITEFMQEMDGLKSSKEDNVIVIGATNRPFDLDDAVLRRLPRRLLVDLPGEKERKEIIKILLRDEALASDVSLDALAKKTDSFSGSDLKHLCVSAALDSVKEHVKLPWTSRYDSTDSASSSTPDASRMPASSINTDQQPCSPQESAETQPSHSHTQSDASSVEDSTVESVVPDDSEQPRILHLRHFTQALKEITPSSSESLGSLSDLRKWNEEFGEGRRDRKKRQVWGKGRFGFVDNPKDALNEFSIGKE